MRRVVFFLIFPLLAVLGPIDVCQMENLGEQSSEMASEHGLSHCHKSSENENSSSHEDCEDCQRACCHNVVSELSLFKILRPLRVRPILNNFRPYIRKPQSLTLASFRPPILC